MKVYQKILAVLSVIGILLGTCACGAAGTGENSGVETSGVRPMIDKRNVLALDVEVSVLEAFMVVSTEEEAFKEGITADDVELYVLYFGDKEETKIKPDNLMRQAPGRLMMNFTLKNDITTVELKIKPSGTLTNKEYVGATQDIIYTFGAGEEELQNGIDAIRDILKKGTFSTIMSYGMSAASGCTSIYSILQCMGYVKNRQMDNVERALHNIMVVEDSVDALDKKLDTVYGNLKAELEKINLTTKRTLRNTYAQQWSDFKTQYVDKNDGLSQQITAYKNKYAVNFCQYPATKTGTLTIYYDEAGAPVIPLDATAKSPVSLEGTPIDTSRTISVKISDKTFAKSKALKIKAIDDETFVNTFDGELQAALRTSKKVTDKNIEQVTEDAMAIICAEVTMDTLNEKGKNGTVADDLIDSYTAFCNKLCDTTANPMDAYRYLIAGNYNFQSEAKNDIVAFNDYILALAADGRIYCDLAATYASISREKKNSIDETANKLAEFVEKHDGLQADKDGAQYCYVTESYLTAAQYTASLYENIKCHLSVMVFFTTGQYDGSEYRLEWTEEPTDVISTSELREIYATYKALYASGATKTPDFENYFLSMLAVNSQNAASFESFEPVGLISGSSFGKRSFSLDGTTKLKAYSDVFSGRKSGAAVHAPCDYFETGKTYALGKEFADSDADKGYFTEHSALFSDVMDIKTEKFYSDKQLLSGAMYIEASKSFIVDELWEFAGVANLTDADKWSSTTCGYTGDPAYDPQHPWGDTNVMDYFIANDTHAAGPLNYYLKSSATFWAIVHAS